jgi:hypothetical protein
MPGLALQFWVKLTEHWKGNNEVVLRVRNEVVLVRPFRRWIITPPLDKKTRLCKET